VPTLPSFPNSRLGTQASKLRFANARELVSSSRTQGLQFPSSQHSQKRPFGRACHCIDSKRSFDSCVPKPEFGNEVKVSLQRLVWISLRLGDCRVANFADLMATLAFAMPFPSACPSTACCATARKGSRSPAQFPAR